MIYKLLIGKGGKVTFSLLIALIPLTAFLIFLFICSEKLSLASKFSPVCF